MAVATIVAAGDMYKWQDKDGIWHFSSTPPETDEQFATVEMPADPTPMVTMRKLGIDREPEYSFINNIWGPVELELSMTDVENVASEPALPARLVLPGQTERRLLKIRAIDPGQGFSFRLVYKEMIGPPLDQLPAEVDYYPPFPLGQQFQIMGIGIDKTEAADGAFDELVLNLSNSTSKSVRSLIM